MSITALFLAACATLPRVAFADTIALSGGYVDLQPTGGPLVFVAPGGFTVTAFAEWSRVESPILAVDSCNAVPTCTPGTTLSIDANFSSGDVQGGTATWRGVSYPSLNGLISPNALTAQTTSAPITLPPLADAATITTRFSLTGLFIHSITGAAGQTTDTLSGAGTVTVHLNRATYPGFPDAWRITAIRWNLDSPLPQGWMSTDVGVVAREGSTSYSNGEVQVAGSGADIWGTSDAFQFAFNRFNGDGSLVARVVAEQDTNTFAKAGVMFRRSLVASAGDVILDVRPNGQLEFMTRPSRGAQTTYVAGAAVTLPVWLRLTRSGDTMTGAFSSDGATWSIVGAVPMPPRESGFINMDDGFAGLAVTSHADGLLNEALFDQVGEVAAASSVNLLAAPGFEAYTPPALGAPGWSADAIRQVPAKSETNQPHSGSQNGACWSPSYLDCGLFQDVKAPTTGRYTLTIFANADAGGLVGINVNGVLQTSVAVDNRGFGTYGDAYVLTFSAVAGDVIRVWMYKPAVPGWVVIDDGDLRVGAP